MGNFTAAAVVEKYFVGFHVNSLLSVVSGPLFVDRVDRFVRLVRYDRYDRFDRYFGLIRSEVQGSGLKTQEGIRFKV